MPTMPQLAEDIRSEVRTHIAVQDSEQERTIREFAPVIRAWAYRLAMRLPAHLDVEDLMSAGVIGLMDAMMKYDSSREAKFRTYAEFRIRGAMLDEIRSMDWIPRSVRERILLVHRTHAELVKRLGRPPTKGEVAGALNLSLTELEEFLSRSQGAVVLSMHELIGREMEGNGHRRLRIAAQQPDPLATTLTENIRQRLTGAIDQLPEKERTVLILYYRDELTMREIGSMLKITESRVSQIRAKAILCLRAKLHEMHESARIPIDPTVRSNPASRTDRTR